MGMSIARRALLLTAVRSAGTESTVITKVNIEKNEEGGKKLEEKYRRNESCI